MSLTSFVSEPTTIEQIKPLRPAFPRKIPVPLLIEPRSGRANLVGIAFDYLLRFEIHRRSLKAWGVHWVADHAPEVLRGAHRGEYELRVQAPEGGPPSPNPPPGGFLRAAQRAQKVLDTARDAFADYMILESPPAHALPLLAAHALRLARLDLVYRARFVDPDFKRADPEDVEDLLAMLAVVPFGDLLSNKRLLLNPTFGAASQLVGGADADLILGDLLIDVKTTKQTTVRADFLDQLFGYFLLARRARRIDKKFPLIRRLGLYFARHGHLWTMDSASWTENPAFRSTETWFFEHAKQLYSSEALEL